MVLAHEFNLPPPPHECFLLLLQETPALACASGGEREGELGEVEDGLGVAVEPLGGRPPGVAPRAWTVTWVVVRKLPNRPATEASSSSWAHSMQMWTESPPPTCLLDQLIPTFNQLIRTEKKFQNFHL